MANRQYQIAYLPLFQPSISDNRETRILSAVADTYVVGQYEKIEYTLNVTGTYQNAFDTSQIRVDAIIHTPSGKTLQVPCFYYQDYKMSEGGDFKRTWVDNVAEDDPDRLGENFTAVGSPTWKLRFAYHEIGTYRISFSIVCNGSGSGYDATIFEVVESKNKGTIKVHSGQRYFQYQNGDLYYPIGMNLSLGKWDTVYRSRLKLPRMAAHKGNFGRLMPLDQQFQVPLYDGANTAVSGWGKFNLALAYSYDKLFEKAAEYGVHLQCCLFNLPAIGDGWESSSGSQGGSYLNITKDPNGTEGLTVNKDFFNPAHPYFETTQQRSKDFARYWMARYGWSTVMFGWEIFNEVNSTKDFTLITESQIKPWCEDMIAYIRSIDYHNHPITNSFSGYDFTGARDFYENTLDSLDFDYLQVHFYHGVRLGIKPSQIIDVVTSKIQLMKKPCFIGESGVTIYVKDTTSDICASLETELYNLSICNGCSGTAMHYYDDEFYNFDLFKVFDYAHKIISVLGNSIFDAKFNTAKVSLLPQNDATYFGDYTIPIGYAPNPQNLPTWPDEAKKSKVIFKFADGTPTATQIYIDNRDNNFQINSYIIQVMYDKTGGRNQTTTIEFQDSLNEPYALTRDIGMMFTITSAAGGTQVKVDVEDIGGTVTETLLLTPNSDGSLGKNIMVNIPTGTAKVTFSNPYLNAADTWTWYAMSNVVLYGVLENQNRPVSVSCIDLPYKKAFFLMNERRNYLNKYLVGTESKVKGYPGDSIIQIYNEEASPILSNLTFRLRNATPRQTYMAIYDPFSAYYVNLPYNAEAQYADNNDLEFLLPDLDSYLIAIMSVADHTYLSTNLANHLQLLLDTPNSVNLTYASQKDGNENNCPFCKAYPRSNYAPDDEWAGSLYAHCLNSHSNILISYLQKQSGDIYTKLQKELAFLRDTLSKNIKIGFNILDGTFIADKNLYNTGVKNNQIVLLDSFGTLPPDLKEDTIYKIKIISWCEFELYDRNDQKVVIAGDYSNTVTPYYVIPYVSKTQLDTFLTNNQAKINKVISLMDHANTSIEDIIINLSKVNVDKIDAFDKSRKNSKLQPGINGIMGNDYYIPKKNLPIQAYPQPIDPASCFLYLTFDDYNTATTTYADISGQNNNGTRRGTFLYTENDKKSVYFNNYSQDYIRIPRKASFYPSELSICLWFNTTSTQEQRLICNKPADAIYTGWEIWSSGNSIQFTWGQPLIPPSESSWLNCKRTPYYDASLFNGKWYCCCVTFNANRAALYIDGVEKSFVERTDEAFHFTDSNIDLALGSRNFGSYWYSGKLAIVQVYNKDIGLTGVKKYYYSTAWMKDSVPN